MIVEFIETKETRIPYPIKNTYTLRKDKSFFWLQRLCCWIMGKIGAYAIGEKITYTKHIINPRSFMERLDIQRFHLVKYFDCQPTKILIGAEDFAEMMKSEEIRHLMSFRAEYNYGREIIGLQVEVIPWMRGILVMP
jgi:hypothetical protein